MLAETHLISLPQHTNIMSHHYFNFLNFFAVVVILVSKYGVYSYTCGFIVFTCFCKLHVYCLFLFIYTYIVIVSVVLYINKHFME